MPRRMRNALRAIVPILGIQLFLVGINIATEIGNIFKGTFNFWAIYPLMAMMIPQFIIFGRAALGEDKDDESQRIAQPSVQAANMAMPVVDASLRDDLIRVRTYKIEIDRMRKSATNESQRMRLEDLNTQFDAWMVKVERMAERIAYFKRNGVVQNDLQTVPVADPQAAGADRGRERPKRKNQHGAHPGHA